MNKNMSFAVLLGLAALGGCADDQYQKMRDPYSVGGPTPAMDSSRKVSEQDCSRSFSTDGNLKCQDVSEAERRARIAEEERLARERKEAAERAERERLERERLAREEAARKLREAEEARLAAERARLEAEAARKAQEERERREKAEAEALARQRAEQEKREAAAAECRRREQEWLEGRAALENFVGTYGSVADFKGIAGRISAFLKEPRKAKPCPPA